METNLVTMSLKNEPPPQGPECEDCDPKATAYAWQNRWLVAYAIGGACFLLMAGSLRAWPEWMQLLTLVPSAVLTVWTGLHLRQSRTDPLPVPPATQEPATQEWAIRYLEMADKNLFGWATLLALAHSGAVAFLTPRAISAPTPSELTIIGGVLALLGLFCSAATYAMQTSWNRAQRAIHWAKHNGPAPAFFGHVHPHPDGRQSQQIVLALTGQAAFTWVYVGTCILVFGLILWTLVGP